MSIMIGTKKGKTPVEKSQAEPPSKKKTTTKK